MSSRCVRSSSMIVLAAGVLSAAAWAEAPRPQAGPERAAPLQLSESGVGEAMQSGAPGTLAQPDPQERLLLRHAGEAPIVGWQFGCVYGLQDGRSAHIGVGEDSFGPSVGDPFHPLHETALLRTGETVPVRPPIPPQREGSFEVWSCGTTAVIFADGTTWGAPQVLERMFERRRHEVRDALRLLDALNRLDRQSAGGRRRIAEPAEARSVLESALPENRWGRYRTEVAAALAKSSPAERSETFGTLRERVEIDLEHMLRQLRSEDLQRLPVEETEMTP